ncbi:MAG: hypothetical protein KF841_04610 [Phycisphaerae bacterium]|nr:hypothetical protein [Phycisphaerae bacterium]
MPIRTQSKSTDALTAWRETPPPERMNRLKAIVEAEPNNATAWYLLGAVRLRAGQTREAARCFGAAYHRDDRFESAAILTFSCLKSREDDYADFVFSAIATYREVREKNPGRTALDAGVLNALDDEGRPLAAFSPIGRVIWCMTSPENRNRLDRILGMDEGQSLRESERKAPPRR